MKFIKNKEKDIVFVVGMQKSGTSLLNQILMKQDFIKNPFLPEGRQFWGDEPPFSPVEVPCGEIYQKHNGEHGHHIDKKDYSVDHKALLVKRINEANVSEPVLMNKNPYNSVRITWLREMFPSCKIIAVYRNPVSNIYSLLKKYVESGNVGPKPEEGWWGIKPINWRQYVSENKLLQCCNQWNMVNSELLKHKGLINVWFEYQEVCRNPNKTLKIIQSNLELNYDLKTIENIKSFDDEYMNGSRFVSKNKEFRVQNKFDLSDLNEDIQFPPLKEDQINEIKNNCNNQWSLLKLNRNCNQI